MPNSHQIVIPNSPSLRAPDHMPLCISSVRCALVLPSLLPALGHQHQYKAGVPAGRTYRALKHGNYGKYPKVMNGCNPHWNLILLILMIILTPTYPLEAR